MTLIITGDGNGDENENENENGETTTGRKKVPGNHTTASSS